jgi:hypothetical protein
LSALMWPCEPLRIGTVKHRIETAKFRLNHRVSTGGHGPNRNPALWIVNRRKTRVGRG